MQDPIRFMRTLIVDDHLMFREAVKRVCKRELSLEVVAEASTGEEAIEQFRLQRPNLVFLDLYLPGRNGFSVAAQLSDETPPPDVVIISAHCTEFAVQQLTHVKIRGFIDKNASSLDSIKLAVWALKRGTTFFSESYLKLKANLLESPSVISTMLSDREIEILPFIAEGMDDLEISNRFAIAQNTAKKHRLSILAKFNQESTPKLMAHLNHIGFAGVPNSDGALRALQRL